MANPLVAFALVAEEYEKSGDPIRGLKPLFAPLLSGKGGQEFDPARFAKDFTELYGLEMSTFVANALSERLAAIDLLVPQAGRRSGDEKYDIAKFDWSPESIDEHQIDQTVKLFIKWAKAKAASNSRTYSDETLENAILLRLARPEFASIFTDADGDQKITKLRGMLGIAAVDSTASDESFLDYLVADFVLTSSQSAPEVFNSISLIAYGSLLADAVAGLAVPETAEERDPPLRVVLDGPIILDVLDMNTIEHHTYALGLMDVLKAAKFRLAVFDHSVDEMRGSIRSTLVAHAKGSAFGPLAERLRTKPGFSLFASSTADTLESKISALGITVLRSEIYEEARFKKYFPDDRVDRIRNTIGELHENVEARIRDTTSVATVARLKGENRKAASVLDAGTIFVTRNSVLCKRVLRALSVGKSEPDPRFTIATDGQIAGILWFTQGARGIDLSRKRLISNCSSAVLPRREVVARIATMLNSLDPKLVEEFSLLMTDGRASMCPMRITGGLVEDLDPDRSLEVLNAMREALSAPVLQRAVEAEAQSAAYRVELESSAAAAKATAIALQSNVANEEELRAASDRRFSLEIAQFELDLAKAKNLVESKNEELRTRGAEKQALILSAQNRIATKHAKARRVVLACIYCLVIVGTVASILLPEFGGIPLRIFLVVVYVASFKWVSGLLSKFADWLVGLLYRADERYLAGLRDSP